MIFVVLESLTVFLLFNFNGHHGLFTRDNQRFQNTVLLFRCWSPLMQWLLEIQPSTQKGIKNMDPIVMKGFERAMLAHIQRTKPDPLEPLQYACRPNRSTSNAVAVPSTTPFPTRKTKTPTSGCSLWTTVLPSSQSPPLKNSPINCPDKAVTDPGLPDWQAPVSQDWQQDFSQDTNTRSPRVLSPVLHCTPPMKTI